MAHRWEGRLAVLTPPYVPIGIRRFIKLDKLLGNVWLNSRGLVSPSRHYSAHCVAADGTFATAPYAYWPMVGYPFKVGPGPKISRRRVRTRSVVSKGTSEGGVSEPSMLAKSLEVSANASITRPPG